jgi:sulfite reductase (NADPH) flavoprotein alpha-component
MRPGEAAALGTVGATALPLLILYGSQTGTAEKLARQIAREGRPRGVEARVVEASAHATIHWKNEQHLLVVTSTYGDGDLPDNAQDFWKWLKTEAAAGLSHLKYSVLALGDTHYEQFCAAGKKIDARLEQLGAKRIHPLADCDVEYEAKAKTWMTGVWSALVPAGSPGAVSAEAGTPAVTAEVAPIGSKANPFSARLLTNHRLNGDGSEKETRHFEISLAGSAIHYEAGDALGVYPSNCPKLVEDLLGLLGCDGEEAVAPPGTGEMGLRKALTEVLDITRPPPELLQHLGRGNGPLGALLAPERKEELKQWLWGREVLDVLLAAPEVKLTPGELVALLKKLQPRLYSISSSPNAHAGQVHLTINIVRFHTHGRDRKGVASTFLADRVAAQVTPVPVFIQTASGFRLPADGDMPVVMVGPGTGVAPFRAFLHERRAAGAKGRNWLFFGEQRAATDFYYREELEQMRADGHLTRLVTAFSRDQAAKIYVQHRMLEHAAELWSWMQDGAHFYVCGDASRMAKDVDAALHQVVQTAGGMSVEAAAAWVGKMKTEKRYQRDVY